MIIFKAREGKQVRKLSMDSSTNVGECKEVSPTFPSEFHFCELESHKC
jgi:hypothetical protein